ARSDPGCRFVIPDPVHPVHDLDPLGRAPAGDEGIRERHIGEIDGEGIIDDAVRAGWSRGPNIGTTICVEPCKYLIEPTAQTFWWHRDPDPHWKPAFGLANGMLCGSHEAARRYVKGCGESDRISR